MTQRLEDQPVAIKLKLALAWSALMFLYIYNDYFNLYMPGTIENMSAGRIGPFGKAGELVFVGLSMTLAIPALMIFLSAALPAVASRWLNVVFGAAYTVIEGLTFSGALFYQIVVGLEIALTLTIIVLAWRWPRGAAANAGG